MTTIPPTEPDTTPTVEATPPTGPDKLQKKQTKNNNIIYTSTF